MNDRRDGAWPTAAVGAVAFALLAWSFPVTPVSADSTLFMLFARDCVDLGQCRMGGEVSSLAQLSQGAAWTDLIVLVRLFGGDADALRRVVLALDALAVALVFRVVSVRFGTSLAGTSAAVMTGILLVAGRMTIPLNNPSCSVFADTIVACALLGYAIDQRQSLLVAAAFALGWSINFHLGAVCLLPALIYVAAAGGPRPVRQVLLALLVCGVTTASIGWRDLVENTLVARENHLLLPAALGIAVLAGIGAARGRSLRHSDPRARAIAVAIWLVLPFAAGMAFMVLVRHQFSAWYLPPMVAPGSVAVAALVHGVLGAFMPATSSARTAGFGTLLFLWTGAVLPEAAHFRESARGSWTYADARTTAAALVERGWSYDQLLQHVHGQRCEDLTSSLGLYLPASPGGSRRREASPDSGRSLSLRLAQGGEGGRGIAIIGDGGEVILLEEAASWLRPAGAVFCLKPDGPATGARCSPAIFPTGAAVFSNRANPGIYPLEMEGPVIAQFEVPLAPSAGEMRTFVLRDANPPGCEWRIIAVEGVTPLTTLPARQVDVRAGSGAPGRLVLAQERGTGACHEVIRNVATLPCLSETTPGERLPDDGVGN